MKAEQDLRVYRETHAQAMITMEEIWGQAIVDVYAEYFGVDIPAEVQKSIDALEALRLKQLELGIPVATATTQKLTTDTSHVFNVLDKLIDIVPKPRTTTENINIAQSKIYDVFKGIRAPWMQSGTYNVPTSGLYNLHGGEQVIPRTTEKGMGGGNVTIHVDPISIDANITSDTDAESLVQKIEGAIQSGLIRGIETEYR